MNEADMAYHQALIVFEIILLGDLQRFCEMKAGLVQFSQSLVDQTLIEGGLPLPLGVAGGNKQVLSMLKMIEGNLEIALSAEYSLVIDHLAQAQPGLKFTDRIRQS